MYSNFERTSVARRHGVTNLKVAFVLKTNTFKYHQVKSSQVKSLLTLF